MNRKRLTILIVTLALGACAAPATASLTADYHFNGDFKNSHGPGKDLTKVGSGGDFQRVKVFGDRESVWQHPKGTGLRLGKAGNVLGHHGKRYTFVLLVSLNVVDSYRKLVDFDNLQTDEGWYEYSKSLYPYDLSGFDYDKKRIPAGAFRQIVLTRDGQGMARGFVGDELIGKDDDPNPDVALGPDKVLHFLMNDTVQTGEESGGQIARLRIFDSALSAKQIKHLGH